MALFGKKKTEEKPAQDRGASGGKPEAAKASPSIADSRGGDIAHILSHARITEKATMQQGANVYTFDVAPEATKRDIVRAIRSLYRVTPKKVAVVTIPSKTRHSMRTGRAGVKKGGKKAYVFLRKGDAISLT